MNKTTKKKSQKLSKNAFVQAKNITTTNRYKIQIFLNEFKLQVFSKKPKRST